MANLKPEDIGWGLYREYEGPFYKGRVPFQLPAKLNTADKIVAVITATEGGRYDAVNMYDRMIISVGLIQWGEAGTFSVSSLLGEVCKTHESHVLKCLEPALVNNGAAFKKNSKGLWRFYKGTQEVTSIAQQQLLFLGCDGKKGSWTQETKTQAKLWAACVANIWQNPEVCEIQRKYTANKVQAFMMPESKELLLDEKPWEGWVGATRSIYLSFAANLPKTANDMLVSTKFSGEKWSEEWCLSLVKHLTFGPNITIYPHRYDAIRPVVARLFGVNLPQTSKDLLDWKPIEIDTRSVEKEETVQEIVIKELQTSETTIKDSQLESNMVISQPETFVPWWVKLLELIFKLFGKKKTT